MVLLFGCTIAFGSFSRAGKINLVANMKNGRSYIHSPSESPLLLVAAFCSENSTVPGGNHQWYLASANSVALVLKVPSF